MRGFALFAAGIIVGLGVTAGAQNLSPNHGIVGLSFVGVNVTNLDKAVEYYTKTLGFPEAYRQFTAAGDVQFVIPGEQGHLHPAVAGKRTTFARH